MTKMDSRPDNLALSEDASVDESVPIYLRKARIIEEYKDTMSKDIENINTYESRKN